MGLNSTKSSLKNTEYSLILSSSNNFYRGLSTIQGELYVNIQKKLRIEKKLRIDLIGQLIENKKCKNENFFTYSYPLVTTHENGIARIIKKKEIIYPFRIPLGMHLPPTCEFKEFSINYFLEIYHDGKLLSNIRKNIILAPPIPQMKIPLPCQVTDSNDLTIVCGLQKSYYSGRDGSIVPLSISIKNSKEISIHSFTIQLFQMISLNEIKYENEIFTIKLNDFNEDTHEKQINRIYQLNLPSNLPATYIPNEKGQPDNVPLIAITYEFRIISLMKDANNSNLRLSVPIGIE